MNDPTHDEHFIPKVYFRGFSDDGKHLYCYDKAQRKQIADQVKISSQCFEKDLYEFKNSNGEIININWNEKVLGRMESEYSRILKGICSMVKVSSCGASCFLTKHERAFIGAYISFQLLRMPEVIEGFSDYIAKTLPNDKTKNDQFLARNVALILALPFDEKIKEDSDIFKLVGSLFVIVANMSFAVVYDPNDRFITSDMPFFIYSENESIIDCSQIVFPLSSNLCLFLYKDANESPYKDNSLNLTDDETILLEHGCVIEVSKRFIYSRHPLEEKTVRLIQHIMNR